jgi:large subunit ribosomal protein L32
MVQMKRHTSSDTKRRRSHHALKPKNLATCTKCGKPVLQHKACAFCGTYKFVEAVNVKKKIKKTVK